MILSSRASGQGERFVRAWVISAARFPGPITDFGSTGPRNTFVEHSCSGTEGERLSRPLVSLQRGPVQVCLRVSGQVQGDALDWAK